MTTEERDRYKEWVKGNDQIDVTFTRDIQGWLTSKGVERKPDPEDI